MGLGHHVDWHFRDFFFFFFTGTTWWWKITLSNLAVIYLGIYCIYYWVLVYDGLALEISILISLQSMQPLNPRDNNNNNNDNKKASWVCFPTHRMGVGIGHKMRPSLCRILCCFHLLNPHLTEELCVESNRWEQITSPVTWDPRKYVCVLRRCS